MTLQFRKTVIVTGHYGSGKTTLSLNLAMAMKNRGEAVALADLDIVNPYFRTADFRGFAAQNGIELVASEYAGSNLDIPALTARLDAHIGGENTLIIDVGGDDAGAYALGRYAERIERAGYTMLYAVNAYRYLTREPGACAGLLREIETASRLKATHLANCSNLGTETEAEEIRASMPYAAKVSELVGLPVALTAARTELVQALGDIPDLFPVTCYVTVPWNKGY